MTDLVTAWLRLDEKTKNFLESKRELESASCSGMPDTARYILRHRERHADNEEDLETALQDLKALL
jgi:hypothetical protein